MFKKKEKQMVILKKLLGYIRKYTVLILFSLLFAAVSAILTLYVPILTGQAIDRIIGPGNVEFAGLYVILRRMVLPHTGLIKKV